MKKAINNIERLLTPPLGGRGAYITPHIEIIFLDNEISLALESSPPAGPSESLNFNSDNPFKVESGLV